VKGKVRSSKLGTYFDFASFFQMAEVIPADSVSPPLREKRLGHDLRGLIGDSPEGKLLIISGYFSYLNLNCFLGIFSSE
jgi:hypothetical protein